MVSFGAHAFVWIGDWNASDGDAAIVAAGKEGFDFIEIPLLEPDSFEAARHRDTLAQAGLGATCSLVLPRDAHLPHHPDRAKAFLIRALDKVAAVGSSYLAGCIAYSLGTLTGEPPRAEERARVIEVLREITTEAEARGITLALEACNRYETYLYNTLGDTSDTVEAVGASNLKVHGDTYHMNIEENGFYEPIVENAGHLDYLHMSESHRGLVGSGTVDWDEVWRGLRDIGFSGSLVLESFAAANPKLAAATCLWRPPQHGPEVLARQGLRFLKEGAARHGLWDPQSQ